MQNKLAYSHTRRKKNIMKKFLHKIVHILGLDYPCTIRYARSKYIFTCKKCGIRESL